MGSDRHRSGPQLSTELTNWINEFACFLPEGPLRCLFTLIRGPVPTPFDIQPQGNGLSLGIGAGIRLSPTRADLRAFYETLRSEFAIFYEKNKRSTLPLSTTSSLEYRCHFSAMSRQIYLPGHTFIWSLPTLNGEHQKLLDRLARIHRDNRKLADAYAPVPIGELQALTWVEPADITA